MFCTYMLHFNQSLCADCLKTVFPHHHVLPHPLPHPLSFSPLLLLYYFYLCNRVYAIFLFYVIYAIYKKSYGDGVILRNLVVDLCT